MRGCTGTWAMYSCIFTILHYHSCYDMVIATLSFPLMAVSPKVGRVPVLELEAAYVPELYNV